MSPEGCVTPGVLTNLSEPALGHPPLKRQLSGQQLSIRSLEMRAAGAVWEGGGWALGAGVLALVLAASVFKQGGVMATWTSVVR